MPYRTCDFCGSPHYSRPSLLAKGMGRYCSKSCSNRAVNPSFSKRTPKEIENLVVAAYQDGNSLNEAGALFGMTRGGVLKILKRNGIARRSLSEAITGRVFTETHKQRIREKHANVSGKNNPMFGRAPGHGRRTYVEHLNRSVRSTWEAVVAKSLHGEGIRHEYERHRITLSDRTYLPDFYLPELDLHVEVKGWENKRFPETMARLFSEIPNFRLAIIGPIEFKSISEKPETIRQHLIPSMRFVSGN